MMNAAPWLVDWTLRSSALIVAGACLIWTFRIKDASIRLASMTAILAGSLALPLLSSTLPAMPFPSITRSIAALPLPRSVTSPAGRVARVERAPAAAPSLPGATAAVASSNQRRLARIDRKRWLSFAVTIDVLVAVAMLLRLFAGLTMSLGLLRRTTATGRTIDGIDVRESDHVATPVTLGILRPVIVLPVGWRDWDAATLDAVLAHERSHITRRDPAVQLLSLVHRSILWHSPLAWLLHRSIVQAAEDASDDAAMTVTADRATYAEILLGFMQRGIRRPSAVGVPMARYGSPARRINRILDGTRLSRGLTWPSAATIVAIAVTAACLVAAAQTRPEFEVADVHVSPLLPDGRRSPAMEGGAVRGGRYALRNATMVDLIAIAYTVRNDAVVEGPPWLASERYDVVAKPPQGADATTINSMLRSLLADRFGLVARAETRPMPTWVLSKRSGEPALKRPRNVEPAGCRMDYDRDRVRCRDVTMDAFVEWMRSSPNNVLPIVNATGIEGSWDFDLDGLQLNRGRGFGANTPIVAAVARQLGLTLERQDVPQPVIVVTGVNRQPTSNVADVDLRLPPEPVEFEVASIRPCDAVDLRQGWRATPSGQLTTGCQTIGMHIARAWNLTREFRATPDRIVASIDSGRIAGAPGWFNSKRYNVVAKAPIPVDGAPFDPNYRAMLRNLLTERFKITSHYEDRPVDVYTLIADRPKLTKADPSARSECRSSGLVPNTSGDAQGYATVITCRNATMAQFAEELSQAMAIAVTGRRIVDETGIHGTWDLTLTYRVTAGSSRVPVLPGTALAIPSAADPDGSLSPLEAVAKQLGLRLTEARRPRPVLVIDHIEETPTEN